MSLASHMSTNVLTVSCHFGCFRSSTHSQAGDHYVHFECKNLAGYSEAEEIARHHPTMTVEKVCNSPIYSMMEPWKQLGFAPHDFATVPYYDMWHKDRNGQLDGAKHRYKVTSGRKYDLNSIMQYPSIMCIAGGRDQSVIQHMPLVAWTGGWEGLVPHKEATSKNAKRLNMNLVPSKMDCKGVVELYPWEG